MLVYRFEVTGSVNEELKYNLTAIAYSSCQSGPRGLLQGITRKPLQTCRTHTYVCTGTPNKDESRDGRTLHLRLEMQVFVGTGLATVRTGQSFCWDKVFKRITTRGQSSAALQDILPQPWAPDISVALVIPRSWSMTSAKYDTGALLLTRPSTGH